MCNIRLLDYFSTHLCCTSMSYIQHVCVTALLRTIYHSNEISSLVFPFLRRMGQTRSDKLLIIFNINNHRFCLAFTGIKFIVLADPRQSGVDALLRKIYEIYSDFALKNPFYSLEMPIRLVFQGYICSLFFGITIIEFTQKQYI